MTCALAGALWSCKAPVDHKAALMANEWQLKEMRLESGTVALPARVPTIVFADSNRVSGFSGCNRFAGTYALKGETISLGKLVTTHMFCMDNMAFEQQFQDFLSVVTRYSVVNGELTLRDKGGEQRLVFVPKVALEEKLSWEKGADDDAAVLPAGEDEGAVLPAGEE
jgi:heat shock protein HslJ